MASAAEQLALAKLMREEFQKSGTYKTNSTPTKSGSRRSGSSRSSARSSHAIQRTSRLDPSSPIIETMKPRTAARPANMGATLTSVATRYHNAYESVPEYGSPIASPSYTHRSPTAGRSLQTTNSHQAIPERPATAQINEYHKRARIDHSPSGLSTQTAPQTAATLQYAAISPQPEEDLIDLNSGTATSYHPAKHPAGSGSYQPTSSQSLKPGPVSHQPTTNYSIRATHANHANSGDVEMGGCDPAGKAGGAKLIRKHGTLSNSRWATVSTPASQVFIPSSDFSEPMPRWTPAYAKDAQKAQGHVGNERSAGSGLRSSRWAS